MFKPLSTDRLVLRPLVPADAEAMFAYRAHPDVSRYQNWAPAGVEEIRAFIRELEGQEPGQPGVWYQVGLARKDSGELAGDIGIHVSATDARQAEFGITLAPAFQGQGLASEALHALFGYLFSELGLHRVTGSVDPRNTASMALLTRAGMRREGHHVASCWTKGEWTDDAVFALLAREWEERDRREAIPMDAVASFLAEAEKLKRVERTAYVSGQARHENSAEHSWHLALALLTLAREGGLGIDLPRAVAMALVHDLCEIDAGDVSIYDPGRADRAEAERACVARLAALGATFGREVQALWNEYEAQETRESHWVRVLDRFLPFLVNLATEGRAWRDRNISRSQVLAINEVVRVQTPELFAWMRPRIDACVAKGWLRDA